MSWSYDCPVDDCDYSSVDAGAVLIHIQDEHAVGLDMYPVVIRESRYGGAYSGGQWVITAGVPHPGKLDAFGSDPNCMGFWNRVEIDGPCITVDTSLGSKQVYVASGDDPTELYEEFREWADDD